jgi:hypothetical protein
MIHDSDSNVPIPRTYEEIEEELERMTKLWMETANEHAQTGNPGIGNLAILRAGFRDGLAWVLKKKQFREGLE